MLRIDDIPQQVADDIHAFGVMGTREFESTRKTGKNIFFVVHSQVPKSIDLSTLFGIFLFLGCSDFECQKFTEKGSFLTDFYPKLYPCAESCHIMSSYETTKDFSQMRKVLYNSFKEVEILRFSWDPRYYDFSVSYSHNLFEDNWAIRGIGNISFSCINPLRYATSKFFL